MSFALLLERVGMKSEAVRSLSRIVDRLWVIPTRLYTVSSVVDERISGSSSREALGAGDAEFKKSRHVTHESIDSQGFC